MAKVLLLLFIMFIFCLFLIIIYVNIEDWYQRRVQEKREQWLRGDEPKKAIDYSPESVVGWEDIQWTVEKRLPKEDR